MKKAILLGSAAYRGSTMLDLMLSNTPTGFSCGEVHALFRPRRRHHRRPACACGDFEIVHVLLWRPPDYAHSCWRRREAR